MRTTIYDTRLNNMVRSPNGSVGQEMNKIARHVERRAKQLVGKDSGELRASIRTTRRIGISGPEVIVGSDLNYAYFHHEGTRRHTIKPKPGRVLRFNIGGRIVIAESVDHPGTRANKYLLIPLREAVQ